MVPWSAPSHWGDRRDASSWMELLCSSHEAFDPWPFTPQISPEEKKAILRIDLGIFGAELENYDTFMCVLDSWDKVRALTHLHLTPVHPALAVLLSSMLQMHCQSLSLGSRGKRLGLCHSPLPLYPLIPAPFFKALMLTCQPLSLPQSQCSPAPSKTCPHQPSVWTGLTKKNPCAAPLCAHK